MSGANYSSLFGFKKHETPEAVQSPKVSLRHVLLPKATLQAPRAHDKINIGWEGKGEIRKLEWLLILLLLLDTGLFWLLVIVRNLDLNITNWYACDRY